MSGTIAAIGIALSIAGLLAAATSVAICAWRVFQFARRGAALRKHLLLDPEWYARQAANANRLSRGSQQLANGLGRSIAAFVELVVALRILGSFVNGPASAIEEILGRAFPELRGILAPKRGGA